MEAITPRDRYRGALVGVLAGDALGAPYETRHSDRIKTDFEKRGGLVPFDYESPWADEFPKLAGQIIPAGKPTDDSDHTAALAESLIACKGLNQEDLYNRLRHVVYDHVSPLWDGRAFGAGRTTKKVLAPTTWAESQALDMSDAYPSNGSLMRAAPLGLLYGDIFSVDRREVRKMSVVTHRHYSAGTCCAGYVAVLAALLSGLTVRHAFTAGALHVLFEEHTREEFLLFSLDDIREPQDPEKWPGRGAAVLTLNAALWALATSDDFREGITKVVGLGGDTDTYGAVAGGLLGARFGLCGIPSEWQNALIGKDKMIELADALYDLSHT